MHAHAAAADVGADYLSETLQTELLYGEQRQGRSQACAWRGFSLQPPN